MLTLHLLTVLRIKFILLYRLTAFAVLVLVMEREFITELRGQKIESVASYGIVLFKTYTSRKLFICWYLRWYTVNVRSVETTSYRPKQFTTISNNTARDKETESTKTNFRNASRRSTEEIVFSTRYDKYTSDKLDTVINVHDSTTLLPIKQLKETRGTSCFALNKNNTHQLVTHIKKKLIFIDYKDKDFEAIRVRTILFSNH